MKLTSYQLLYSAIPLIRTNSDFATDIQIFVRIPEVAVTSREDTVIVKTVTSLFNLVSEVGELRIS